MKDWMLVVFLIPLAAIALGLFGLIGLQGFVWDRAYDHALSAYKQAYAHRDDPAGTQHARGLSGMRRRGKATGIT
jgi:hypothetical protein